MAAESFYQGASAYFGEKHSVVASGLNNLALVHKELGELEKAVEYYEKARVMYEELLGKEHTSTLTTLTNLGVILRVSSEKASGVDKMELADRFAPVFCI
jgi:tetratricopeptide (TPR) repeat protein